MKALAHLVLGLSLLLASVAAATAAAATPAPPDFVDRYVAAEAHRTPDFVDRYVAAEAQRTPDFVDRYVARRAHAASDPRPASEGSAAWPFDPALGGALALVVVAVAGALVLRTRRRVAQAF